MANKVRSIVIVGGGIAGWMTANYLNKALSSDVKITLADSKNINNIGVGESTFNTIKIFFDYLGLRECEWMPRCLATYKMGIKFVDWAFSSSTFYHPFQRYELVGGFNLAEWWIKLRNDIEQFTEKFDSFCFNVPALCDDKKSPKYLNEQAFTRDISYPYAYHFDVNLLVNFLREIGVKKEINYINEDVIDALIKENGKIDCVITANKQLIYGDLFIDCSGFRRTIINAMTKEQFISFGGSLLCDSAIVTRISINGKVEGINPYTTATALSSGWAWNIPLFNRASIGYVYSSSFISKSQAEDELIKHLNEKSKNIEIEPFHIQFYSGRYTRAWINNCVTIGLSESFVEPLESTGIFFIQHAIAELVNHFPDLSFNQALIKNYNRVIANRIDGVRDFLILHYCTNSRKDTNFWNAARHEIIVPEDLKQKLELWKNRLPNSSSVNSNYHGFAPFSYSVMLLGLNHYPKHSLPALDNLNAQKAQEAFMRIQNRTHRLGKTLPSHYEYLIALYEQ